ncbi:MAG: hypothetical protein AAF399_03820 [Bacteroidota bacterium]
MSEHKKNKDQSAPFATEAKIGIIGGLAGFAAGLGSSQLADSDQVVEGEVLTSETVAQLGPGQVLNPAEWLEAVPEAEMVPDSELSEMAGDMIAEGQAISLSTIVHDGMNFDEAFGNAREELGAGGTFVWRGNIYGTYYKEEWENLSTVAKNDYWSALGIPMPQATPEPLEGEIPIIEAIVEAEDLGSESVHLANEVKGELKEEAIENLGESLQDQFGEEVAEDFDPPELNQDGFDDLDALADLF